ncbi:MAG: thiol-disulfide oxidoreductase DCC family protein [Limisphaerales bacterium]
MVGAENEPRGPGRGGGGPHLVLYDGECGLCHGLVEFVLARDRRGVFHFAPLQGPSSAVHLARFGGVPSRLSTIHLVAGYQEGTPACLVKARAVLAITRALGWPWRAVSLLAVLPTAWLDWGYDVVARHRHRFMRRRETCPTPRPEHRDRFVDLARTGAPEGKGAR